MPTTALKWLTVMRHAHAEAHRAGRDDFARELDARGRKEAERMARVATTLGLRPAPLLASPAARTRATAETLAQALGLGAEQLCFEPRLYNADLETLVELLQALQPTVQEVLLVGHNPGVSELVGWLAGTEPRRMPPAGLCRLQAELGDWSGLERGAFAAERLRWPGEAADR